MMLRFRPAVCSRLPLDLLTLGLLLSGSTLAAEIELPAVKVQGQDESGYQAATASVAGFSEAPLVDRARRARSAPG